MTGRFALVALAIFVVGRSLYGDAADEMFDRIAENWRWSHYWFGKTGIDDVYVEGKQISALIFWTKSESQPIHGLCSSELGACVAYSGVYLDPAGRRMQMAPNTRPRQAFRSFISSGFADSSHIIAVEGIKPSDFESAEKSITLPALDPPSSISRREVPAEAGKEGERIKRLFRCWGVESETKPNGCSGSLVFAYYGPRDPYWFVLRSCAAACDFKGEAVEMLRRGDRGWEITSAGFVDNPKEAERLKEQIEKAEMIRLPL
ncbi:MAG TPA: hypothetical protein VKX49_20955 [Bryobacteraceae bacterium]|nr:hypothetical protein [Bryobacteraceae bacterium]